MKKSIAMFLLLGFLSTASLAQAKGVKCTVTSIEGETIVLDCGDDAQKLSPGDTVKVETGKKKKKLEGC